MKTIGVRELKTHISEILRQVREEGQIIEVTNRGQVIARVVPTQRRRISEAERAALNADMDRLADEISAAIGDEVLDVVEIMNDVRMDIGTFNLDVLPDGRPLPRASAEERVAFWHEMDALAAELEPSWPPGVSALDILHDVRQEVSPPN